MTIINYIWIGPPSSEIYSLEAKNHDVSGVIKMLNLLQKNKIQTTVYFWCLDEYEKFYSFVFKKYQFVKVKGIKNY
ncbi:hypothetical protein GCL60_13825 [Silvanigrella paludirubra]|uniref:Uncharacterized protein n=1 Tax=Silvanigrella paludirubra TaxID=2499159 RepID=A0A6N6VQF8_9BACT|nr:hypothetical protein [Silvanigrella paludirubra]KAB8036917.1 hypothetical protein GCL60_13825 [Silvanigrella paludirubra]